MKKSAALILVTGMVAASVTAHAGWFGKLPGSGSLLPKMKVTPTMPAARAPQEPCFRFAYTAKNRSGVEDVFSGGNCLAEPKNLTRSSVPVSRSHLASGRTSPDLAFIDDDSDPSTDSLMSVMNVMSGGWNNFEAGVGFPEHFRPEAGAWDGAGRMAVVSREKRACRADEDCDDNGETDGGFALRLIDGAPYSPGAARLVRTLGMVPPQDMEWVPVPGQARSRFLIVSFGNIPEAIGLYVFDMEATEIRPVPLESGTLADTRVRAMFGAQPAVRDSGEDLLFVRHNRIFGCLLDFSSMNNTTPRAFCTDAREPQRLAMIDGAEMASPAVSQDGEWLFFAMKTPSSGWDIYRSSLTRIFLTPLTNTPSVDEKEVVSVPDWMEITSNTAQAMTGTIREETLYVAAPLYQTVRPIAP